MVRLMCGKGFYLTKGSLGVLYKPSPPSHTNLQCSGPNCYWPHLQAPPTHSALVLVLVAIGCVYLLNDLLQVFCHSFHLRVNIFSHLEPAGDRKKEVWLLLVHSIVFLLIIIILVCLILGP